MLCRQQGAVIVDNVTIEGIDVILTTEIGEDTALNAEFKMDLNKYLKDLVVSPVRSLADVINFNKKFAKLVSF